MNDGKETFFVKSFSFSVILSEIKIRKERKVFRIGLRTLSPSTSAVPSGNIKKIYKKIKN